MESSTLAELDQQHQALTRALDRSLKNLKSLHAQRRFLQREYDLLQVRLEASTSSAERETLQWQIADLKEALAVRLEVLNEKYQPVMQLKRDIKDLERRIASLSSEQQLDTCNTPRLLVQAKLLLLRFGISLRKRQSFRG